MDGAPFCPSLTCLVNVDRGPSAVHQPWPLVSLVDKLAGVSGLHLGCCHVGY